jgi:macrodomain Ter protein organizer (MatP/YcbG family)
MGKTLTIRLDSKQERRLAKAAKLTGKTVSQIVREVLDESLAEHSVAAKAGHLKGQLSLPSRPRAAWARQLKERNWRE